MREISFRKKPKRVLPNRYFLRSFGYPLLKPCCLYGLYAFLRKQSILFTQKMFSEIICRKLKIWIYDFKMQCSRLDFNMSARILYQKSTKRILKRHFVKRLKNMTLIVVKVEFQSGICMISTYIQICLYLLGSQSKSQLLESSDFFSFFIPLNSVQSKFISIKNTAPNSALRGHL